MNWDKKKETEFTRKTRIAPAKYKSLIELGQDSHAQLRKLLVWHTPSEVVKIAVEESKIRFERRILPLTNNERNIVSEEWATIAEIIKDHYSQLLLDVLYAQIRN